MKKAKLTLFALIAALTLFLAPIARVSAASGNLPAQSGIVARYNFDPKTDGYGFENFGNDKRNWQDDLGAEDLIRLFGAKAACKTGNTAQNCVLKAAAREWIHQQLEGMNGGHCEGMAVTSLRMMSGLPFKGKAYAANYQPGAASPFNLKLAQPIENYIAYFFVTQGFEEVAAPSLATAQQGPVAIAKMLIESMKAGNDTYSLGFYKFKDGRKFDGHAITPIAVEDAGNVYRIHVYDNNYPGATRYVVVEKGGKQTWKYVTSTNPSEPAGEYVGDMTTKTLELTATSLRERGCFDAPFAPESSPAQCTPVVEKPVAKPAEDKKPAEAVKPSPVKPPPAVPDGETVEFSLNADSDLLVINGDGKLIGFDPRTNKFTNEIPGAKAETNKGGLGENLPRFTLPYQAGGKPYTVIISGKNIEEETNVDLTYAAPGLAVGFDGIRLDPGEAVMMTIAPNGEILTFTASGDGETPEIYLDFDPESADSYGIEVDGAALDAGKTMTVKFDGKSGKLQVKDNDGNSDKYDVDIVRTSMKGAKQSYEMSDVGGDDEGADSYEIELNEWDGTGEIKVKHDDEGNGFDDDEEFEQENEDNDDDADDADDEGDDEDSDVDNDGTLNDEDEDDDGDGTSDEKDTDDDNDGESDSEDDDDNDDDDDEPNWLNLFARVSFLQ